jgi:hypothetical protein
MSSMPLRNALLPSVSGLCALALSTLLMGPATAATRTVSNCNDSGPGSLRNVVANALDGDTINLGSLGCSRILLIGGEIEVPQNDLELVGRSRYALAIDGNRANRVFRHTGTGTLRFRRVSIANGYLTGLQPVGGCIYSLGGVELIGARVHHCELQSLGSFGGGGGGIYAERVLLSHSSAFANIAEDLRGGVGTGGAVRASDVVLDHSQVYGNRATMGGGIGGGSVTATYSVIRNNQALHAGGILAGCREGCAFTLRKSTVSANVASSIGGGFDSGAAESTLIVDSTLSDNIAGDFSAGALSSDTRIFNSTIAFNLDTGQCTGAINDRAGLHLVSSIVSRNTCSNGVDRDINVYDDAQVMGSNNIIGASDVPVPADTILAKPRLGPLTDNGGPTPTRMPAADSPALDRGINPLNCQYDQRGPGFPRVKGGFPDIGAVER